MVDGKAVATWALNGGKVTMSPFGSISRATRRALDADAASVVEYLG
jgi:hypothetical protein